MRGADTTAPFFDRRAWRLHRERAARRGVVFLHEEVAQRLLDRLGLVNREFHRALDLGTRDGQLAEPLAAERGVRWLVRSEPAAGFFHRSEGARVGADPEL